MSKVDYWNKVLPYIVYSLCNVFQQYIYSIYNVFRNNFLNCIYIEFNIKELFYTIWTNCHNINAYKIWKVSKLTTVKAFSYHVKLCYLRLLRPDCADRLYNRRVEVWIYFQAVFLSNKNKKNKQIGGTGEINVEMESLHSLWTENTRSWADHV